MHPEGCLKADCTDLLSLMAPIGLTQWGKFPNTSLGIKKLLFVVLIATVPGLHTYAHTYHSTSPMVFNKRCYCFCRLLTSPCVSHLSPLDTHHVRCFFLHVADWHLLRRAVPFTIKGLFPKHISLSLFSIPSVVTKRKRERECDRTHFTLPSRFV